MGKSVYVSIIIPVYQSEPYIRKCIDSVLNQSFDQFEVIIVDDGSSDNGGIICDEYAERDTRITVIHQQNCGVSSARNCGLDVARGKYVMFVDSDDLLPHDALQKLVDVSNQTNADIIVGQKVHTKSRNANEMDLDLRIIHDKNQILDRMLNNQYDSVWGKMFIANIAKKNRFVNGKQINEDVFYVFECLLHCKSIAEINYPVYQYLVHETSASHAAFSEKFYDILYFMEEKIRILNEHFPERIDLISATQYKHYLALCNKMASCRSGYTKNEFYDVRSNVLRYKDTVKLKSRKEQIRLWLIKYCIPLYLIIMRRKS